MVCEVAERISRARVARSSGVGGSGARSCERKASHRSGPNEQQAKTTDESIRAGGVVAWPRRTCCAIRLAMGSGQLRVLFVTGMHPTPARPRQGIIVIRQAEALRKRGHCVDFCELGTGGPLRYLRARSSVRATAERLNPEVVHIHFGYGGLAVPSLNMPVVTSFYGDDLNGTWTPRGLTWASRAGILASQFAAFRSKRCIVVSDGLRQRLWSKGVRHRTSVIPDAVDTELFRPMSRDAARRRFGLGLEEVIVLFPHDVTQATKRLGLAEAAIRELRSLGTPAHLWVVNDVDPRDMPWV